MSFDYFVILADMRTGSNLLEDRLSAFKGVSSYGELFNPHFIGRPKAESVLGFDVRARNADPLALLGVMTTSDETLPGFRLFRDHDPRVLAHCLDDPRCAKIILTRNTLDSFVSLQIARRTGQWWMGDIKKARTAKIRFDAEDYSDYRDAVNRYRQDIRQQLQMSGQTAFFIDYDELGDDKIIAGLAGFLGLSKSDKSTPKRHGRPQNPTSLRDKVTNPRAVEGSLKAQIDLDADERPEFEPSPPPGTKGFVACTALPLLHLTLASETARHANTWLMAQDRAAGGSPRQGSSQRDLRKWLRSRQGHIAFVLLEHPLLRAFHAFVATVLDPQTESPDLVKLLASEYDDTPDADLGARFSSFLTFLEPNLKTQTSIGVDRRWGSQTAQVQSISSVVPPRRVLEWHELPSLIANSTPLPPLPSAARLENVATPEHHELVRRAYRRDFMMFGFSDYTGSA